MIKHFCDKCGVEIDRDNQFEHKEFKVGKHAVTLSIQDPQTSDDALCLYCVLEGVANLDNRPKECSAEQQ